MKLVLAFILAFILSGCQKDSSPEDKAITMSASANSASASSASANPCTHAQNFLTCMQIRDRVAMAALAGVTAQQGGINFSAAHYARSAYDVADAMILERITRGEGK